MFDWARALAAAGLVVAAFTAGEALADGVGAPAPDGAKIVNGIPTNLQPTTGALLFVGPDLKNQFLDCSGVLIGCRTVLTAAHCICKSSDNYADCLDEIDKLDVSDLRFFLQHSGFQHIRDIYINPNYRRDTTSDLAVLRLSELVTGIEPARPHEGFPVTIDHGTDGVIAGFGSSADDKVDSAIKRVGNVETAACPVGSGVTEPSNICWTFTSPVSKPGDESNLCLKDDGGPMFIDFGKGPEVAGIHAGSGSTCNADSFSFDTNVVRSRDWIKSVGGPDIDRDQCSDLGEVGQLWVKVQGGQGVLPKNDDEARFTFNIPKDTIVLRVTVNGDTENDADYDMFVGLGDKIPTKFVNDCQQRGSGQFGACSFDDPGVEKVNILIRHVRPHIARGKSRFQVTVTAFEPTPPLDDAPAAPTDLHYTKRDIGLRTLLWSDNSDNELGFQLERRPGTDTSTPFTLRATIGANQTKKLESIADSQVFTYRIRAFNAFGASDWSNLCVVNFPRFPRPGNLHAESVTATSVALKWRDKSDGESKFEVQRRLAGSLKWNTIKTLPADSTTYVDNGVQAHEDYEYRVRARGFPDECIPHSHFSLVLEVSTP